MREVSPNLGDMKGSAGAASSVSSMTAVCACPTTPPSEHCVAVGTPSRRPSTSAISLNGTPSSTSFVLGYRVDRIARGNHEDIERYVGRTSGPWWCVSGLSSTNDDRCFEDHVRPAGPHEGRRSGPHRDLVERLLSWDAQ